MSMADELGISEMLFLLINTALDHASGSLSPEGEPFIPFLLVDGGGDPELERFSMVEPEDAVDFARMRVGQLPIERTRYAIAFDGMIREENEEEPTDSIIVEAGERDTEYGIAVALRYRITEGDEPAVEELGGVEVLGRIENFFNPDAPSEEE